MKIFTFILSIFCLSLFLQSCSNDDTELPPIMEIQQNFDLEAGLINYGNATNLFNKDEEFLQSSSCFTVNYPYSVSDGDTETVINSEEDFIAFLVNLESPQSFFYVYPFTVTLEDGSVVSINSDEEYILLLTFCSNENPDNTSCLEVVYPVTVVDDLNNQYVVENAGVLNGLMNIVGFVYPVSVVYNDETVIINNEIEFDQLYNECNNVSCTDCDYFNCFRLSYPLSIVRNNGVVTTFNSDDQLQSYLNSLPQETSFSLVYPITANTIENQAVTITNEVEFLQLLEDCN